MRKCYNKLMLLISALSWWYGAGWAWALHQLFIVHTKKIEHFFSISDLLKTLFAPFRQDNLTAKGAPISIKLQVLGGNIISRIFGFIIRFTLIMIGLSIILISFIIGVIMLLLWPLLPITPLIGIILFVTGVGK